MLEAVQAQARADVEDARRARDEARARGEGGEDDAVGGGGDGADGAGGEGAAGGGAGARDEATPRDVERTARARRARREAEARGGGGARARREEIGEVGLTPGRSPSAASFATKVALAEARARGDVERRRDELAEFFASRAKGWERARGRGGGGGGRRWGRGRRRRRTRARRGDADDVGYGASDDGDASLGTDARRAAVEWGVAQSEAYSTVVELMKRVMMVLERASELASVDDAAGPTDEDDVEARRSWSAAAADLRDPDPTLEQLVRWLEAVELVDDEEHAVALRELMARMCASTRAVVFSLKRAVSAAAEAREETSEAYAIAEEAAEVYRLHLAQAESRATMAERRAVAAEEATDTITELCADARRERRGERLAPPSARAASSAAANPSSPCARFTPGRPLANHRRALPRSRRRRAPASPRSRRRRPSRRAPTTPPSPTLRELQNLRLAFAEFAQPTPARPRAL